MEIWKDIYFFENEIEWDYRGKYQVSNYGNIKSLNYNKSGKEKVLKQWKNKDGRFRVKLQNKIFLVHRIVGFVFLNKDYFDGAEINHIDENPSNNHVDNLEWCTREYNINYGNRNKKASEKMKGKNNSVLIARYSTNGNLIDIKYQCDYVKMGFRQSLISECCNGKRKTTGRKEDDEKFIFKYFEEI
jgi:hypothetical protein